jgi:hypothetical protein
MEGRWEKFLYGTYVILKDRFLYLQAKEEHQLLTKND